MTNVWIASGPPGSGKTYQMTAFALALLADGESGVLLSADHYFSPLKEHLPDRATWEGIPFSCLEDEGVVEALKTYEFNVERLSLAHQQCMMGFLTALYEGDWDNIIIDNTNIHSFEISPYYLVGESLGAEIEILRIETPVDVCIKRNIHGVPKEVILKASRVFYEEQPHPWIENTVLPKQHMPWWTSRTV